MRNHSVHTRPVLIEHIAQCVPEGHAVALENPEMFILVEVFKVNLQSYSYPGRALADLLNLFSGIEHIRHFNRRRLLSATEIQPRGDRQCQVRWRPTKGEPDVDQACSHLRRL